jgi:hypothetical protein
MLTRGERQSDTDRGYFCIQYKPPQIGRHMKFEQEW